MSERRHEFRLPSAPTAEALVDEWLALGRHQAPPSAGGPQSRGGSRRQAVAGGPLRDAGPAPRPRRRGPCGDHVGTGRGGSRPRHRERRAGVGPRRGGGAAHRSRRAPRAAAPRQRDGGGGHGAAAPGGRARHGLRRTLRSDVRGAQRSRTVPATVRSAATTEHGLAGSLRAVLPIVLELLGMSRPALSVVVVTLNEEERIRACLAVGGVGRRADRGGRRVARQDGRHRRAS